MKETKTEIVIETNTGRVIYGIRVATRQTQTELAQRLGITQGYLAQLEHGKARPSRKLLERIAEKYELRMEQLIGLEPINWCTVA